MTVRASTLISVQWPPEPVSEGPDTLVLSVGTYYVDLRVSRHDGSIYWALAGRRIVVSEDPRKVRFTHEFDSHQPHRNTVNKNDEKNKGEEEEDEEVADEGEFTKLPNGDDLEIGEMPAPHLGGKVSPYREIWRELKIGFDDEEGNQDDDTGKETCWIIESLNDAQKRTFYCKVGKFFLALRRTERRHLSEEGNNEIGKEIEFSAIRQELISKTDEQTDEHWVTKYSIGTDADDMFHMSRSSSDFVLENINGKSAWGVDDQVVVRNKGDGSIREVCVVRAVN